MSESYVVFLNKLTNILYILAYIDEKCSLSFHDAVNTIADLSILRLNSGIRIRHNFFVWAVFLFQKLGTDSVNYADSGDIKILV